MTDRPGPPCLPQALELWIQSVGYGEIARAMGLDTPKDAERLVRAGLERLRRHFRDRDHEPDR